MVSEGGSSPETEGKEGVNPGGSNTNDAKSLGCDWYKGSPWDTKAPVCSVNELDKKAYDYRASSRTTYRPDKEFIESGIPDYVEWCVNKFINQYENVESLVKYKEYKDLRKGLNDLNTGYLSTRSIMMRGLRIDEEAIKDIKLQVFLYYIVFLRSYKLIWRKSIQSHNRFSVYFRYSIFLKIGDWLRRKVEKFEHKSLSDIGYEEEIVDSLPIFSPLGPREISKLCLVSERQIKNIFANPDAKQKLVDSKYLKVRNIRDVSRIDQESNLAQDWGIHIQRVWKANHKEGD